MPPMTVSADAQDTLVGKLVADRYRVEAKLGEGGMGSVYRARHVTLDKPVALKVLHAEFSRKEDFVRRFLLEAKAASRIRNQHVIDITDFGTTDEGYVFFSMEFLAGKDLHSLLRSTLGGGDLLPWERSKGIFLQVCDALSAAHEKGIIHRDLKPENIFLVDGTGKQDFVKLLDFGIAKVEQAEDEDGERKLTKTGMLFGTPEYMAPEQARGEKPDHRVDVYAMGCLLFQFITGTVPFQGESFMAILTQHMIEEVPPISVELLQRSGAPMEILEVIEKALVKDREQRYSSIEELSVAVANAGMAKTRLSMPAEPEDSADSGTVHTDGGVEAVAAVLPEPQSKASKAKFLYGALAVLALGVGVFVVIPSGDEPGSKAKASPTSEGAAIEQEAKKDVSPKSVPVETELVKETRNDPEEGLQAKDENGTGGVVGPAKEDLATVSNPDAGLEAAKSGGKNSKGKTQNKAASNRGPDKNGSKGKDSKNKGEVSAAVKDPKTSGDPKSQKDKSDKGSKVQIGDVKTKNDFPTE